MDIFHWLRTLDLYMSDCQKYFQIPMKNNLFFCGWRSKITRLFNRSRPINLIFFSVSCMSTTTHYLLDYGDYIVTFLKTFKYEFVNCKQSKNKYGFTFIQLSIFWAILCATVQNCTTITITIRYSAHNRDLQATTIFV